MIVLGKSSGRDIVASGVFIGEIGSTYELYIHNDIDVTIYIDVIDETEESSYTEWVRETDSVCKLTIATKVFSGEGTGNYGSIDIKSDKNYSYYLSYFMSFLAMEGTQVFYSCTYSVAREKVV